MKAAVLKKLRQPSTWAGLAAIYAALAPLFGVEAARCTLALRRSVASP